MKIVRFGLVGTTAYINSASRTVMKLWMSTPPFFKFNWATATTEEKYKALMDAFDGSQDGVPMPENPKAHSKEILVRMGFKSWKDYFKKGLHCEIEYTEELEQVCFVPLIYLEASDNLYGIKKGKKVINSSVSQEEMIRVLKDVLDQIPSLAETYDKEEANNE
jgi:hypothetical protein